MSTAQHRWSASDMWTASQGRRSVIRVVSQNKSIYKVSVSAPTRTQRHVGSAPTVTGTHTVQSRSPFLALSPPSQLLVMISLRTAARRHLSGRLAACAWVCLCLANRGVSMRATSVTSSYSTSPVWDCCSVTVSHKQKIKRMWDVTDSHLDTQTQVGWSRKWSPTSPPLFLSVYQRADHKNVHDEKIFFFPLFPHHPAMLSLTHTHTLTKTNSVSQDDITPGICSTFQRWIVPIQTYNELVSGPPRSEESTVTVWHDLMSA